MIVGLLLLAATPLANGAVVEVTPRPAVPWVEIAVHLATDVDPPELRGLTAVSARVIDAALAADPACAGVCSARLARDGITIRAGAAPDRVDAEVSRIFDVVRAAGTEGNVERAVRGAAAALDSLRADDRRLVYFELMQVLFADHPARVSPLGDVVGVSRVTAEDVSAFVRRTLVGARVSISVAGAVEDAAAVEALAGALSPGAAVTSTATPPRAVQRVRVVVVDKPDRTQAEAVLGWPVDDADLAALEVARLAWSRDPDSPLARLAREKGATAVAQLVRRRGAAAAVVELSCAADRVPELLDAVLTARRTVERRGLAEAALERGVAAYTTEAVLARRDALHAVGGSPLSGPVDAPRARTGVRTYARAEGLIAVVLASATPELLARLAGLPQVDEVEVVAYDNL